MLQEQEYWKYSQETQAHRRGLERLSNSISSGTAKAGVLSLFINGGIALAGQPEVAVVAMVIEGVTSGAVFFPSQLALLAFDWKARIFDRNAVWIDNIPQPTND